MSRQFSNDKKTLEFWSIILYQPEAEAIRDNEINRIKTVTSDDLTGHKWRLLTNGGGQRRKW